MFSAIRVAKCKMYAAIRWEPWLPHTLLRRRSRTAVQLHRRIFFGQDVLRLTIQLLWIQAWVGEQRSSAFTVTEKNTEFPQLSSQELQPGLNFRICHTPKWNRATHLVSRHLCFRICKMATHTSRTHLRDILKGKK